MTTSLTPEQRLENLGLVLPLPQPPIGNFRNVKRHGNLLYVSGQGPVTPKGEFLSGKVGADVTAEVAQEHAQLVGLNILGALKAELGELSRVADIIKLLGMVNATPDFEKHPFVINGCSNLLCEVFGDAGPHARSAIGVGSLPNNITVEIEVIAALKD